MKKILYSFCVLNFIFGVGVAAAAFSCGPGYVLEDVRDIDGMNAAECQKLWCRDLETGKSMGNGNRANSGYKTTSAPVELCDASNNCVECFGERRWCSGESVGQWNPEYGAYTRGDSVVYQSYQKGSCFAWRLEKPNCDAGETAVLRNGEWVCTTSTGASSINRGSAIRRTGTVQRVIK